MGLRLFLPSTSLFSIRWECERFFFCISFRFGFLAIVSRMKRGKKQSLILLVTEIVITLFKLSIFHGTAENKNMFRIFLLKAHSFSIITGFIWNTMPSVAYIWQALDTSDYSAVGTIFAVFFFHKFHFLTDSSRIRIDTQLSHTMRQKSWSTQDFMAIRQTIRWDH